LFTYLPFSLTPLPSGGYYVTYQNGQTEQSFLDYFDGSLNLVAEAPLAFNGFFADLNGDGKPDVVSTIFVNHNAAISIALGTGGVTFLNPAVYPTNCLGINTIVAVDVNNDHKPDIVTLCALEGTIEVYLGNGDGTLQAPQTIVKGIAEAGTLALADLNGDGTLDLIYTSYAGVSISLGHGDGTFSPSTGWTLNNTGADGFAIGDLNGDGIPDILLGGSILFGDGKGGVQSQSYISIPPIGQNTYQTILTDFNGDGIVDIVFAIGNAQILGGDSVSVIYGLGGGAFAGPPFTAANTNFNNSDLTEVMALASADFNGDGFADLVLSQLNGGVTAEIGKGDGTFQPAFTYTLPPGIIPYVTLTADFNGDGKPDFAVLASGYEPNSPASIAIVLGDGAGRFQQPILTAAPLGASAMALGDFNGDGRLDVAVLTDQASTDVSQTKITEAITIFLGNGDGTFKSGGTYPAGPYATSIAAADFNGDGRLDLVVANNGTFAQKQADASLMLYVGRGDGTFGNATPLPALSGPGRAPANVIAADFNRDGKPDLAVTLTSESGYLGGIMILLGNGNGTFQGPTFYASDNINIGAVDLNGDGIPDLIASGGIGSTSYYLGAGDGTFRVSVALPGIDGPVSGPPIVADFNHDGKPDIASTPGNGIAVILNVTPAAPSVVVTSGATLEPAPIATASLATAFGANLPSSPAVTIEDITGVAQPATVLYSSASQINFAVPANLEAGFATLSISGGSTSLTSQIVLAPVEPTLFTLNPGGLAAAYGTRASSSGATYEPVFTQTNGLLVPVPIDVTTGEAYLILFGTGIRNTIGARVVINGEFYTAAYAGAQSDTPGLDQVNIALPASLAGGGYTSLRLSEGNLASNPVYVLIK
jgi:uncharacterized protein (TIGR03437 family)